MTLPVSKWPSTRAEAKALGVAQYFTGKSCPKGHIDTRTTCSGACTECLRIRNRATQKKLREENPELIKKLKAEHYERRKEHIKARVKANYAADPESHRERGRKYAADNAEAARERARQWRIDNPEKKRDSDREFYANNRAVVTAYKAKYRAARRQACPPWVDDAHLDKIRDIYKEAERLSKLMGEVYHVDHIVPLQGKTVCGLHVWWNLRVLPGEENNRRKRIWEDGPDGRYIHP